jgi:hypothetical protein
MATMNPRTKAALLAAMARQRQGASPAAMPVMDGAAGTPPMVGGMGGAPAPAPTSMKRGGKTKKMAKGGSASARADGIATRGLTKGTFC